MLSSCCPPGKGPPLLLESLESNTGGERELGCRPLAPPGQAYAFPRWRWAPRSGPGASSVPGRAVRCLPEGEGDRRGTGPESCHPPLLHPLLAHSCCSVNTLRVLDTSSHRPQHRTSQAVGHRTCGRNQQLKARAPCVPQTPRYKLRETSPTSPWQ